MLFCKIVRLRLLLLNLTSYNWTQLKAFQLMDAEIGLQAHIS